jgi:hypothetical protein
VVQDTSGNVVRTVAGAVPVTNSGMKQEAANRGGLSFIRSRSQLHGQIIFRSAANRQCDRIFVCASAMSGSALSRTSTHHKTRDFCLIVHVALKQMNEAFGFV